jgi:hypothetical protein
VSERFRGLTKGKGKALAALGVEPLAEGEVSRPVRIRASRQTHERLALMSAREVGALVTRALAEET